MVGTVQKSTKMIQDLNEVMTLREAAERWGLNYETVRQAFKRGKFDEQKQIGTIRKSKGVWLLTEGAMTAVFGHKHNPS